MNDGNSDIDIASDKHLASFIFLEPIFKRF